MPDFPSHLFDETQINNQSYKIDPVMLVDEVSSTLYYIGVSKNSSDTTKPNWRIKKIWKDGSVWRFQFAEGRQEFRYIWDNRTLYTYTI